MLEVRDVTVRYGKGLALNTVSLSVEAGEIVSIVGANGAGKTTIIRSISGLKKPGSGEIWFRDKRIDHMPPHRIARLGIAQVPAGRMIFAPMSVMENLLLGACCRKDRKQVKEDLEGIFESFPILRVRQRQLGGQLSGGQQQMLAMGRAMMSKPALLLMDEPSTGLAPIMVAEIGRMIREINRAGVSVLLVEQNCRLAFGLAERAYVLELGGVTLEGRCKDLEHDERVRRCYLGGI
jgi:branched-chain amino acid transport system ATP-binding protein